MRVGFNYPYPWNAYGVYLGSGKPCGSNPALDRWPLLVRDNLERLLGAGIDCVRIFLFCNAYNLDEEPAEPHPKAIEQLTALFRAAAGLGVVHGGDCTTTGRRPHP